MAAANQCIFRQLPQIFAFRCLHHEFFSALTAAHRTTSGEHTPTARTRGACLVFLFFRKEKKGGSLQVYPKRHVAAAARYRSKSVEASADILLLPIARRSKSL